jgi:hypothetical protein
MDFRANSWNGDANVPSGMLQEVGRAIAEAISEGRDPARAALSAMRTPTREMIEAGIFCMRHGNSNHMHDDANVEAAYQGMIDNALGYALRQQHSLTPI